jgi:bla regulator protein blaR1
MMGWFIDTLIASSVLMGLVLLLRRPVAHRFGPRVAYALWLLPALRMVLPPLPRPWIAVQGHVMDQMTAAIAVDEATIGATLVTMFAAGALAFFTWHVTLYARFVIRTRSATTPLFKQEQVAVGQTNLVQSPLAFGVVEKTVLLPADFADRYDALEQRFAIGHELMHHRRGDLMANVAALIMLSVQWFNPLAHFAFRAFRADQEAACDASVLEHASDRERHAYGTALVKSALGHAPLVACRISGAARVKQRLAHILAAHRTETYHDTGIALASLAIIAGLGLTASGAVLPTTGMTVSRPKVLAANGVSRDTHLFVAPASPGRAVLHLGTEPNGSSAAPSHPTLRGVVRPVSSEDLQKPVTSDRSGTLLAHAIPPQAPPVRALDSAQPAVQSARNISAPVVLARTEQCESGGGTLLTSEAVFVRDGAQHSFALSVCAPPQTDQAHQRTAMLTGLSAARTKIAGDPRVPEDARADVLAIIDLQISQLSDETITML